jgi:hypothetical protein
MAPPELREQEGHFFVILQNISAGPIWITLDDDEWLPNLSLEITDEAGKTTRAQAFMIDDSSHAISSKLLKPQESTAVQIRFVNDGAYPLPFPPHGGSSEVTIRAVLEKTPFVDLRRRPELAAYWRGRLCRSRTR